MTKSEEIAEKCEQAGCNEAAAKRHHQMFVFEHWDVHPPPNFKVWYSENGPGPDEYGKPANPVTAWNSDPCRQQYFEWISLGEPEPPPPEPFDMAEHMALWRASMAKIESRMTHDRSDIVVPEDTRNRGYDKR